jgi:hypothetical protein
MSREPSAAAIDGTSNSMPLRALALGLVMSLAGVGCGDAKDGAVTSGATKGGELQSAPAPAPTPAPAPAQVQPEPPAPAAMPTTTQTPAATPPAQPASAEPVPATPPAAPVAATAPAKDQVKMSKEFWPSGGIKYTYEMRRSSNGKWARNGIGRAHYEHGQLEREGVYRNNVRIGIWKYYDVDGKHIRTEDRGTDGDGGKSGDPPLP